MTQHVTSPLTQHVTPPRRGSYGIDAPFAPAVIAFITLVNAVLAVVTENPRSAISALFTGAVLGWYLHGTLRGKFVVWAQILDELELRGDERILDMGCGRGAVLLMAAQRLTTGRAVGVDLWRKLDQSGNSMEVTRRNAVAEGVADRVELHTGDMTALPFAADTFDVIVSSLAIHNIPSARRGKAIDEAVRVLRPGGRLAITDVRGTERHRARLVELGMKDVVRRTMGARFWWWFPARLVTATKP